MGSVLGVTTTRLRAWGAAAAVILGAASLTACASWNNEPWPGFTPSQSPTAQADHETPCLAAVVYPNLPVWELNADLPIVGASPEYVQAEVGVIRGTADCGLEMQARAAARDCPVPVAASPETLDSMLGSTPDAVTASEFDRGSTAAISELVTGRTADGGGYQYRLSAWQYPDEAAAHASQVPELVETCTGSTIQRFGTVKARALYEGDEPYLIAFIDDATAYLIESIRNEAPDGTITKIADTPTGLLSSRAMSTIVEWWLHYGAQPLDASEGTGIAAT